MQLRASWSVCARENHWTAQVRRMANKGCRNTPVSIAWQSAITRTRVVSCLNSNNPLCDSCCSLPTNFGNVRLFVEGAGTEIWGRRSRPMGANKSVDLTPLAARWLRDYNEAPWRRYLQALGE